MLVRVRFVKFHVLVTIETFTTVVLVTSSANMANSAFEEYNVWLKK